MIEQTESEGEPVWASSDRSRFTPGIVGLVLLGGLLPLAGTLFALLYVPEWRWDSLTAHSVDETLGAFAALTLGILLLMNQKGDGHINYRTWIACGLIVMGIFDVLHALPKPGQAFVWLHSLAVLFGGGFFALVWLPQSAARAMSRKWAVWCVALAALFVGVMSMAFTNWVPGMVAAGKFTPVARAINITGGIFFLAATVYLVRLFYRGKRFDELLFASISLLLGISGILFELSQLWDASWWFWHLLRLIAYLIALTSFHGVSAHSNGSDAPGGLSEQDSLPRHGHRSAVQHCVCESVRCGPDGDEPRRSHWNEMSRSVSDAALSYGQVPGTSVHGPGGDLHRPRRFCEMMTVFPFSIPPFPSEMTGAKWRERLNIWWM